MMRIPGLLFLFLICSEVLNGQAAKTPFPADNNRPPSAYELASVKETLRYEVKYSLFTLGWVDVEVVRDTVYGGKPVYFVRTLVTSNSKLLFVGKEIDRFTSIFDIDSLGRPVTLYYWKDNFDEDKPEEIIYDFDRELMQVRFLEEDGTRDTLDLAEPATAGQLILLHSRMYAGSDSSYTLPAYISKELGFIDGDNSTEIKGRKVPAFDEKVDTYYSEGNANLKGPFGFSGKFKSWFLADDLRVPVESHFRVFIGNVKVRLLEYKRETKE